MTLRTKKISNYNYLQYHTRLQSLFSLPIRAITLGLCEQNLNSRFCSLPYKDTTLISDIQNHHIKKTPDHAVAKAELDLIKRFTNVRKEPIKTPFYLRQLQVFYEQYYSDGIIRKALDKLVKRGTLGITRKKDFPQKHLINHVPDLTFYYNSQINKGELDRITQKDFYNR